MRKNSVLVGAVHLKDDFFKRYSDFINLPKLSWEPFNIVYICTFNALLYIFLKGSTIIGITVLKIKSTTSHKNKEHFIKCRKCPSSSCIYKTIRVWKSIQHLNDS